MTALLADEVIVTSTEDEPQRSVHVLNNISVKCKWKASVNKPKGNDYERKDECEK
jgi:hypothetical protein